MDSRDSIDDLKPELLMQALEFMPLPATLIDSDGRVRGINAHAREFLKITADLLGQHFETLLHVASSWEAAEQLHEVIDQSLAAAEPCCRSGSWQCHRIGDGPTRGLICYFMGDIDTDGIGRDPAICQPEESLRR